MTEQRTDLEDITDFASKTEKHYFEGRASAEDAFLRLVGYIQARADFRGIQNDQ